MRTYRGVISHSKLRNINWPSYDGYGLDFWLIYLFTYFNLLLLYYLVYINPNLITVNVDRVTGLRIDLGVLNALFVLFLFIITNLTYNLIIKHSNEFNDESDFKYLQDIIKYLKQALSGYITGVLVTDGFSHLATKTQDIIQHTITKDLIYTLVPESFQGEAMQTIGFKTIAKTRIPVVIPKSVDPSSLLAPSFSSPYERYGLVYFPVTLFWFFFTYIRMVGVIGSFAYFMMFVNSYLAYGAWLFFWRMEITSYLDSFTAHMLACYGTYYLMMNQRWLARLWNPNINILRHPFMGVIHWIRIDPLHIMAYSTTVFLWLANAYIFWLYLDQATFDWQVARYYIRNYIMPSFTYLPLPMALFLVGNDFIRG